MTPEERIVQTALAYPFARPAGSFLFVDGDVVPLRKISRGLADSEISQDNIWRRTDNYLTDRELDNIAPMSARTGVLAYGANGAPERLAHKFAEFSPGSVIPVLYAALHDFDVVHASHFSSYGSVPATLERSPGTTAHVAVTYLDTGQLARMHETEFSLTNYAYGRLSNLNLLVDDLGTLNEVRTYLTVYGHMADEGEAVALAGIEADGRRFRAMAQHAVLRHARDTLALDVALDDFIIENVRDKACRAARSSAFRSHARAFSHADFEVIEIGD